MGPNLTKVKGNKRYSSVPDGHSLYDSSSKTTNSAWYRQVQSKRGSVFESSNLNV